MNIIRFFIAFLSFFIVVFSSCSDNTDNTPVKVPDQEKQASIVFSDDFNDTPVISSEGGIMELVFKTTASWSVTVRDAQTWVQLSVGGGEAGENSVRVIVDRNEEYTERNAVIDIKCGEVSRSITLTQKQKDALIVESGKIELGADGGIFSVTIKSNIEVSYEIQEEASSWLFAVDTRSLESKTLMFQASANEQTEKRQATIILKGNGLSETIYVYQEGSLPSLVLTQKKYIVGSEEETLAIELKSNVAYEMKVPEADWISIMPTRSMSSYTHFLKIEENDSYDSRSTDVIFICKDYNLSDTVNICQLQKDAILIADSMYEVPLEGGSLDFKVQTNVEVNVLVSDSWIVQRDSRSRGLVERTLCFDILPNEDTSNDREGTITLSNKEKTVSQTIVIKQSKKLSVTIEGDKATIELGSDAKVIKQTISKLSSQGIKTFIVKGDYNTLQLGTDNPFYNLDIDLLDLSGVVNWPASGGLAILPANTFKGYSKLQEVILPVEVKIIGESAFYKCSKLTRVYASGVQKVEYAGFQYTSSLEELILPEVVEIGRVGVAFSGLKKAEFPKLKKLDGSVFWLCRSLTEINLPELEVLGAVTDGTESYRTGTNTFGDCSSLSKVYLPKARVIGDDAFSNCTSLTELDLPMVDSVGVSAFSNLSNVTCIRLPKATFFSMNVFNKSNKLSELYLTAEGSIKLGNSCFLPSQTSSINLHLNPNKAGEVTESVFGKEWQSYVWKDILFSE